MRKIDVDRGAQFGKWSVIGDERRRGVRIQILCKCDCGAVKFVDKHSVLAGMSTGCRKCSGMVASNNPAWKGTKDIPANFFYIAKKSAEARKIQFLVSIDDVQELWDKSGGKCALSGVVIKMGSKKLGWTASLDRINQSGPYTKDNLQFVHKHVNIMKNRFSEDYFVSFCKLIADNCATARA